MDKMQTVDDTWTKAIITTTADVRWRSSLSHFFYAYRMTYDIVSQHLSLKVNIFFIKSDEYVFRVGAI